MNRKWMVLILVLVCTSLAACTSDNDRTSEESLSADLTMVEERVETVAETENVISFVPEHERDMTVIEFPQKADDKKTEIVVNEQNAEEAETTVDNIASENDADRTSTIIENEEKKDSVSEELQAEVQEAETKENVSSKTESDISNKENDRTNTTPDIIDQPFVDTPEEEMGNENAGTNVTDAPKQTEATKPTERPEEVPDRDEVEEVPILPEYQPEIIPDRRYELEERDYS